MATYDYSATVTLPGEVGKEDGEVLNKLMAHAVAANGLQLQQAQDAQAPSFGEYLHLASVDPTARPGTMKVLLRDPEEVRKLYNALDGQTVQVGMDLVGVRVANDLMEVLPVPGNENRRRK